VSYTINWTETRGPASHAEDVTGYQLQGPDAPRLGPYSEAAQCLRDGLAMLDVMRYPVAVDWTILEDGVVVWPGRWYPFAR
tara:strand:+ start:1091 stop:1333 length:243 start_codon:yes stop_codon:yes gene_type:complete